MIIFLNATNLLSQFGFKIENTSPCSICCSITRFHSKENFVTVHCEQTVSCVRCNRTFTRLPRA
jgi:hypothetical protein